MANITMNEAFMKKAIALSSENVESGRGGPFGAVVVKDNNIIATGVNEVTATHDPTAHAEIVAIRRACKTLNDFQLTDCAVYASCEPCPMCLGALFWARPAIIFFANTKEDAAAIGFDDSFIYEQIHLPFVKRSLPMMHIQLMHQEALKAFRVWQEKVDKILY